MTSMIDGIRLEKIAAEFAAEAAIPPRPRRIDCTLWACNGCGRSISRNTLCPDCLRLVADTLRDAASKSDK